MQCTIHQSRLELDQGDIAMEQTDAVVNAANCALAGGSGVDGAIHRAGGPAIMEETDRRYPDGCAFGDAVISGGGNLQARYVIHAVGPIWEGGTKGEADLLASAVRKSLTLAIENDCDSVAFPAISSGAFGYPPQQAAKVALETAIALLKEQGKPALVRFVLFGQPMYDIWSEVLSELQATDP